MAWYAIVASMFIFLLYAILFLVGCWEANLAIQYEPDNASSPGFIHGYAYTIFACMMNIMSSCLLIMMLYFEIDKHETPAFITCMTSIWTFVLFAGIIHDDIQTGPFQCVVIVQFIITIIGFLLCICSCCGYIIMNACTDNYDYHELNV